VLTMVVLGGAGTLIGPVIGAIILGGLPEYLRFLHEWRYVIYGLLLTVLVIFERDGLMGPESRLRALLTRLLRRAAAER
jgi:branched-chain amino acid transport system permease protein